MLVLGPGLIAATAGDDAGGIATYSQVGAKYGYELLWVLLVITLSLALIQETCARLGAATGRGLLDLVRERFGIGWALFAVGVVLLANGGVVVTEFVGIAAAAELFGISRYLAVPVTALADLVSRHSGQLCVGGEGLPGDGAGVLCLPVAAVLAHPDWGAVARGAFVPTLRADPGYLTLFVGSDRHHDHAVHAALSAELGRRKRRPAAALRTRASGRLLRLGVQQPHRRVHRHRHRRDAARGGRDGHPDRRRRRPGPAATRRRRGAGAVCASGCSARRCSRPGVLPLATAYSVAEAFGFRKGVDLDFRRAPVFVGIFSALIALGAAVALIPNLPLIQLLVGIQVLNGMLLPVILVFLLLLINDRRLVGSLKNGLVYNVLSWGTVALVTSAVVFLLGTAALGNRHRRTGRRRIARAALRGKVVAAGGGRTLNALLMPEISPKWPATAVELDQPALAMAAPRVDRRPANRHGCRRSPGRHR